MLRLAQTEAKPSAKADAKSSSKTLDLLHRHDKELSTVRAKQQQASEQEIKLRNQIEALGQDRRKLNEELISTAARERATEARIAASEERLKPLDENERAIRKSLGRRRAVIAEVLAALERIGQHPPPALLVRPDDALKAVRSAILLGAVLPDMRQQARVLAGDLADLLRVRKQITTEHERLQHDAAAMAKERQRLSLLVAERQKKLAEKESAFAQARHKSLALARDADNLKDLIGKLEQGLDSTTRAARMAARSGPDTGGGKSDLGRLQPAVSFAAAKGTLALPVNGVKLRNFGAPDGLGGEEKGILIATRARAEVTSPCDGWVVYAGPFRSYGQLLILDAGGGYHVLLAGMGRISVDVGQFVLAGEPVAMMGSGPKVAAILAAGSSQPILYVEFRKDGTPIDPAPWWAADEGEKARG